LEKIVRPKERRIEPSSTCWRIQEEIQVIVYQYSGNSGQASFILWAYFCPRGVRRGKAFTDKFLIHSFNVGVLLSLTAAKHLGQLVPHNHVCPTETG
jgi:hypothetical protein